MLEELTLLLEHVNNPNASKEDYLAAIINDNCLNKQTSNNRKLSASYLVELYSLDLHYPLFRALVYFWYRDEKSRPLLAMLFAYARDNILRSSANYFLRLQENEQVDDKELTAYLAKHFSCRWSHSTTASVSRNLKASWTKSGHLIGRSEKTRRKAEAAPGAAAYALLLGYLKGNRGPALFQTEYAQLLDRSQDVQVILSEEASRRGWMIFKHIGDVIEVRFPDLITHREMEWVYDQN